MMQIYVIYTRTHNRIHEFIYIYMCVCVCVWPIKYFNWLLHAEPNPCLLTFMEPLD